MRVEKDFKEFIALLNAHSVRYLIVGGFAFSYHAEPRFTRDIDIWLEPSRSNSENVLSAIRKFGFEETALKPEDFLEGGQVIQLGFEPLRIDLMTSLDGVTFEDAWKNKAEGRYGDIEAFFISRADLIKNKLSLGRTQDLADVEKLKEIS